MGLKGERTLDEWPTLKEENKKEKEKKIKNNEASAYDQDIRELSVRLRASLTSNWQGQQNWVEWVTYKDGLSERKYRQVMTLTWHLQSLFQQDHATKA